MARSTRPSFLNGAAISTIIDSYDSVGNRLGRVQDGVSTSWNYDRKYRLTGQSAPGASATFSYDAVDNTLLKWYQGDFPRTTTYDAASRPVTSMYGSVLTTYTSGHDGDLQTEEANGLTTTNKFDAESHLRFISQGSSSLATYHYSGDGLRRDGTESGNSQVIIVWDGSDYLQDRSSTATLADYLTVNGVILSETRGGVDKDYLTDPLGSLVALVASTGITDTFSFWPYGEVRARTGSTPTPYGYVGGLGYRTDVASQRVYVRARVFRPDLGRWLTVDPLWPLELAFGYVRARPLSMSDYSGRAPSAWCLVPCVPCAACLIDLLIVCPPGPGFGSCVQGVWNNLPTWTKILCGVACAGCLACVAASGGGAPEPLPPIPEPPIPIEPPAPEPPGVPEEPPQNPVQRCSPRQNPGFPKGRWYQNRPVAFLGCIKYTGSGYRHGHAYYNPTCSHCYDACLLNGMTQWLSPKCAFWHWIE